MFLFFTFCLLRHGRHVVLVDSVAMVCFELLILLPLAKFCVAGVFLVLPGPPIVREDNYNILPLFQLVMAWVIHLKGLLESLGSDINFPGTWCGFPVAGIGLKWGVEITDDLISILLPCHEMSSSFF